MNTWNHRTYGTIYDRTIQSKRYHGEPNLQSAIVCPCSILDLQFLITPLALASSKFSPGD